MLERLHPSRLPAVPGAATARAAVPGMPDCIRIWPLSDAQELIREALTNVEKEMHALAQAGHTGTLPPAHYLAVSGGGDDGAFGAGVLVGWTQTGVRPEFKMVTGISTGALIAPLAFLGSDHDHMLEEIFTTVSTKQIFKRRARTAALFSDALSDATPLLELITHYVDRAMLARIAAAYQRGRLLLIGTTDLDAREPVVWNMGRIAASDDPRAPDLFRRVLLASAAIPGVFPPVMIDVELEGQRYQEMHVDGGALAQVFVCPATLHPREIGGAEFAARKRSLYIIRNGRVESDSTKVERQTLAIGGRALSALLQSQGIGDLYRIYAIARRDDIDYNLAFIPRHCDLPAKKEQFDPIYMRALFDRGRALIASGYCWTKAPPGYGVP